MSLPDPAARPLLTVDEARHGVGDVLGRSAFYAGITSGAIPGARRIGRRLLVSTAELRAWLGLDATSASSNGNGADRHDDATRDGAYAPPSQANTRDGGMDQLGHSIQVRSYRRGSGGECDPSPE